MNYITTQDLFAGELNTVLSANCATDETLQHFIEEYEPIILRTILGQDFYNQLQTELSGTISSKWDTLVNGGTFQIDGVDYQFKGLKYITAGFIFYWYHRNNAYSPSQTGGSAPKLENSHNISMRFKMASAWNKATELIGYCNAGNNLTGYLENSNFEGYEIGLYEGGEIKGLQWAL